MKADIEFLIARVKVIPSMGIFGSGVEPQVTDIYQIEVQTIKGEVEKLEKYKGKVLLIVNIAGKCGYTGQLAGLEKLYEKYKDQGFVILGFPCNNFLHQEPGTNDEIHEFCSLNYGVTFPLFAKIDVMGSTQHPLYSFLTSYTTNPKFYGKITWNFNKFLIGADGTILDRFGTRTDPEDAKVDAAVSEALKSINQ